MPSNMAISNRVLPFAFSSYKPFSQRVYGCICISKTGKLLVVKERICQTWSLPKGHIKIGEGPEECALREMYEETGITLKPSSHVSYKKFIGGYYIYYVDEELPTCPQDTSEVEKAEWLDLCSIDYRHCNCDLRGCYRWLQHTRSSCSI